MLIRFVVQNVYSFFESKEFNMFPRPRIRTPEGHKYDLNGFELLKLSAIYGANAAGKSNLIKALHLFQDLILGRVSSSRVKDVHFKFDTSEHVHQILAVEFVEGGKPFYYGIAFRDGEIVTEELYISGLGKEKDILLFERKKTGESSEITFSASFEQDEKSQVLKSVLLEDFLHPRRTVFEWIAKRDNAFLADVKLAYNWFKDSLVILTPNSKPFTIAEMIDNDPSFKKYADETMSAFSLGVSELEVKRASLKEIFGKNADSALSIIKENYPDEDDKRFTLGAEDGNGVLIVKEGEEYYGKPLKVMQTDVLGNKVDFTLEELSDGTIRLLDFLPAFRSVTQQPCVIIVDEIERSLHPSLAKELIKKFADDKNTKGQLVFTTHESNLLDQSIFRQDEIWFVEKGPSGSTDIYSLSDFKEHNTIDIRKGYLNGRYGAVPFLANLHDLNWHAE